MAAAVAMPVRRCALTAGHAVDRGLLLLLLILAIGIDIVLGDVTVSS